MPRFQPLILFEELRAADLPVEGCSSFGRVDWKTPPTPEQQLAAAAILAKHNPEPASEKRKEAYIKAKITLPAMVEALWRHVMESDPTAALDIQARRDQVNLEIPLE